MRNLELFYHADRECDKVNAVQHFCVNALENTVYIYDDGVIYSVSQVHDNPVDAFNIKELCANELNSQVVAFSYNSLLGVLCLVTAHGDLLTVNWGSRSVETVGTVNGGLRCAEWSPEEEVLLLITGQDVVLAMTLDFDLLWEQPLHQDVFGEQAFVTVGWGSKQTQFHGTEGKAAARATPAPSNQPSPQDDGSVHASWRGDGALVAVSATRPSNGTRCIRIFNREGALQATSEAVSGLEMALAWRPSGNLIASTQVLPNKYQVVFFEKNGLRHGEFTLPFTPGEGVVRQLAWNLESDVLSIWYEDSDGAHLLLCSVGNYHWYVKQTFSFSLKRQLLACSWDPESRLKLHLVYGSIRYSTFEWIWTVNRNSAYCKNDRALVAVIDDKEVLLTAFAEKVVPPPMCADRLQLPNAVNQVAFGPPPHTDSLCAILSDGRLALFDGPPQQKLRWVRRVCMAQESVAVAAFHHWLWVSEQLLLCVATIGNSSHLVQVNMDATKGDSLTAEIMQVPLSGAVVSLSLVGDGSSGKVLLQTAERDLLQLHLGKQQVELMGTVPERLLQVHVLSCQSRKPCVVGLSARSRLYANGHEVASNVTSMLLLPPDSLLLTTSAHTLLCLQLLSSEEEGQISSVLSEAVSRRVERGSRLITAASARVVLQMPRGNLETITPRALVLQQTAAALDEGQFASVFELLRKQRINLNLLIDHNPEHFLEHAEDFVRDIGNPAWLSLLAVELSEEDVTKTTYSDSYRVHPRSGNLPWSEGGKCAAVCARLREAMETVAAKGTCSASAFFLPTLSTLAAGRHEHDLAAALRLVQEAPERGLSQDDGLRHLLTLCDGRRLFDTALGLYDMELTATVASRSNRDPKEYLPFLNELRRMDEAYRCYRVDAHLNRWESALTNLARCPQRFEEFLSVMQEHLLYSHALTLFSSSDDRYKKVAAAFGEYLMKERKLEEAIVMLRRAGWREEALEACRQAGDWQQAIMLLGELRQAPHCHVEYLRSLTVVLLQQRRFQEAAQLLLRHCACAEEAVGALCQGRLWAEAQQVAVETQRLDLLEGVVKTGILEHFEQLHAEVVSSRSTYESHLQRLRIVRTDKLSQPEEKESEPGPESDLYSDTSSTSGSGSFQSGRTGSHSVRSSRSGKNRRKQERKLLSLKEGAPFEDLALLRALHQTTSACFALRKEVRSLCLALLSIEHDTDALSLQRNLSSTLDLMEQTRTEVWPSELTSPNLQTSEERYGPEATTNSIVCGNRKTRVLVQNCEMLEPQFRIPPQILDHINWKLSVLGT